jgi:translation initiation factor IF-3
MFRGREIIHPHLGRELLERIAERLSEIATTEGRPNMEGRTLSQSFAPNRPAIDKIKVAERKQAEREAAERAALGLPELAAPVEEDLELDPDADIDEDDAELAEDDEEREEGDA